jgi:hypothetical protein
MRLFLAVLLLLSLAAFAACGNDDDSDVTLVPSPTNGSDDDGQAADDADGSDDGADAVPTRRGIPTATPVPDDGVTVLVTGGGELTTYTPVDIRELPETSITAGGESYTGVSVADLAASAGASDATYVTIEGYSPDGQRPIVAQFALADIGADSVFVISETGHLRFASESIDAAQWVTTVGAVDFF